MSSFATIPGGWFYMGSNEGQRDEQPVHEVWVDTFEMGIYPVTRQEYAEFVAATGRTLPREWDNPLFAEPNRPVVGVSWNDAVVYCLWRSSLGESPDIRLPTEAEWERAARGFRSAQRYPWGDEIPEWIPQTAKGPLSAPWVVTFGEPNDFGLYGIAANIHEWCADWHSRKYSSTVDRNPTGPLQGTRRSSRGGSWRHARTISRTSARSKLDPVFRYTDYGFRLARRIHKVDRAQDTTVV